MLEYQKIVYLTAEEITTKVNEVNTYFLKFVDSKTSQLIKGNYPNALPKIISQSNKGRVLNKYVANIYKDEKSREKDENIIATVTLEVRPEKDEANE